VTYTNESKQEMLGVPVSMLEQYGAVSEQVAREMAEGALRHSHADIAVAVTGIAGPGGGSADKPVGLVHLACARSEKPTHHVRMTYDDTEGRNGIRLAAVATALAMVREAVQSGGGLVA
jgi:nicotinamide-nucleotide amidase